ncbi:zinc finger protein ZFP2-like [Chironomus tepperi]|uniref:zinc finger protein ZFP2-like n=1 Tax=Chironomus tepperi TaxID=113505 RepID=UPI00391EFB52
MSNICRLCYEEKSSLDFTVELNDTAPNYNQTYQDLVEYYSRIELNPSKLLPQFICDECRQTIEKFVELSKKTEDVQNRLISLVATNEEIIQYIDETKFNDLDTYDNERIIDDKIQSSRRSKRISSKTSNKSVLEQYKLLSNQDNYECKAIKSKKQDRRKTEKNEVFSDNTDNLEELFSDVTNGTSPFTPSLHININQGFKTTAEIFEEIALREGLPQLRWKDLLCCGLCYTEFDNIVELNNHIERIHGTRNKAYGCKGCEIEYAALFDSSLVNHHIERHYREHLRFCCLVCSKLFFDIPSLVKHYKDHSNVYEIMICYICGFYAKNFNELKDHKAYHIQVEISKPENQILCEAVLEKYLSGEEANILNTEIELNERNPDGTVFSECQTKFKVDWSFLKQSCPIDTCKKQTSRPFETFVHLRLKHPKESDQVKKIYSCNICTEKKDFSGMHYFYNHMAEHHFSSLKFTCIVCNRLFWNLLSLALHYKNVHSSFTSVFCCHCGKIYHSITSAAIHYKKVMILMNDDEKKMIKEGKVDIEPSHICHVCGKACKNYYTLVKHLTTHEAADPTKMIQCHICSKLFNSKNKLTQHMVGHNNQRKWKCSVCGMSFNFKKLLQMHTRAVHEFERTFLCNFCDKRFFKKYDLTVHVRLHTGFFPYSCPIEDCDAKYPAWSNLFKHCQSRHKLDIRSEGYKKLRASEKLLNNTNCTSD